MAQSIEWPSIHLEDVPANNGNCGFGYEMLLSKLEFLESEFRTMNVEMKNRIETLSNELSKVNRAVYMGFTAVKNDLGQIKSWVIPETCRNTTSKVSGKAQLRLFPGENTIDVYCEQQKFGGGWMVFQRRSNERMDFLRGWTNYKYGFGDLDGEFWFGLEKLHQLTKNGRFELAVELEAHNGTYKFARYDEFAIGNEDEMYSLKKLGRFSGTAYDALDYHRGRSFSTQDRDNDSDKNGHCAKHFKGAWWYGSCHLSDLNRVNKHWHLFADKGIKFTRMMLREL